MFQSEESKSYGYDYLINLYIEAFGIERFVVLPFELLRDNKKKFLGIIEDELNLDHYDEHIGRLNESLTPEELFSYPRISSRVANLAVKFGRPRYDKIYSWYIHQTIRSKLKIPIKVLTKWKPDKRVKMSDFPDEMFEDAGEKAQLLRTNPLYHRIYPNTF